MSSKNYKSTIEFRNLAKNLKQIKKLRRFGNFKKMAGMVKITAQHMSDIVNERSEPSDRLIDLMAAAFQTTRQQLLSENFHSRVEELSPDYEPISAKDSAREYFKKLIDSEDHEITDHLTRQLKLLVDLYDRRDKERSDRD